MSDGTKLKISREGMAHLDMQTLILRDDFKRFLWTILNDCGMLASCFHSEDAILAFGEGRRSLGLDILRTAAKALGGTPETALMAILAAETKTQMEVQDGRRNRDQFNRDRNRELGGDDEDRSDDPVVGGKLVSYD